MKNMALALREALRTAASKIDGRDMMLALGLGLLAAGMQQIYAPAAFAMPGAILVCIAIFGVR